MKVFLGDTNRTTSWRESLISLLRSDIAIDFHNPEGCDYIVHVFTPRTTYMENVNSDVTINDENRHMTVLVFLRYDGGCIYSPGDWALIKEIMAGAEDCGITTHTTLIDTAVWLNAQAMLEDQSK